METELDERPAAEETDASPEELEKARKYLDQIRTREEEFRSGWWKRAKDSEKLYSQPTGDEAGKSDSAYNILYSNTEVLVPSLYSATAKPDVRSRFKGADLKPIPEVLDRFLTLYTDSAQPGTESFDDAVKDGVLSALTAAAGCLRLRKYDDQEFPIQTESVCYDGIIWGKAKKWARVPWIAFRHELSKEEFIKQMEISKEEADEYYHSDEDEPSKRPGCVLYEFWHKESRTVWFLSDEWKTVLVKKTPDPLGLKGFFPTPGLLMLTLKPGSMEPVPLYWYYRKQAEELDRVSVRLNKVLSAIRVRGAYASLLSDTMSSILSETDMENGLVPAGESMMLSQNGGFDKLIWLLPIEKLITVAQQLYQARESIKQVIYELTGISDIIRGSNVASETATATTTKDKWGTIRLRKMQTVVANYVRDLFRLAVDAGASQVSPDTWKKLVQLPIPTRQEQAVARQTLQFKQQQAQQMMAMQPPPMPGQPAPPPPQIPPPDPALLAQAQGPAWEDILEKISSDIDRTFTVNIQTSSTVDLDTAQDKAEVTEFMNSTGQMLAGLQPLLNLGPPGMEAFKTLLISVCQRFKFGVQAVEALEKLQPPPPPPPAPPPPGQSPMELEVIKAESGAKLQEIQGKLALLEKEFALKSQEMELARERLLIEKEQLTIDREKLRMELELLRAEHQQKLLTAVLPAPSIPARKPQNAPIRR